MIFKGKIVFAALYALVVLAGMVTAGLYGALIKFPPAEAEIRLGASGAITPPAAPEMPAHDVAPVFPSNISPALPASPPPPPSPVEAAPMPEVVPEYPDVQPEGPPPDIVPAGRRSPAFRDARKAIFQDGTQPDFEKFEGPERQALERMWDQYQVQRARRGGRPPNK